MATFRNVKLKNGPEDCFVINMNGFNVRCVEASNVDHVEVMLEGEASQTNIRRIEISKTTAKAMFPDAEDIAAGSTMNFERRQKQI